METKRCHIHDLWFMENTFRTCERCGKVLCPLCVRHFEGETLCMHESIPMPYQFLDVLELTARGVKLLTERQLVDPSVFYVGSLCEVIRVNTSPGLEDVAFYVRFAAKGGGHHTGLPEWAFRKL